MVRQDGIFGGYWRFYQDEMVLVINIEECGVSACIGHLVSMFPCCDDSQAPLREDVRDFLPQSCSNSSKKRRLSCKRLEGAIAFPTSS